MYYISKIYVNFAMMGRKTHIALLVLVGLLNFHMLKAQQDVAFVQYWKIEPQFNPAAVGRTEELWVGAAMSIHATGYEDAGSTIYAGANTAFPIGKTRHGVGAMFQNDKIGLFSHKQFALQYAFHMKLGKGTLSIGAQADMLNEGVDAGKADLIDGSDKAFTGSDMNGSRFDLSAGLYYKLKNFNVGVGVMHITAPTVEMGTTNEIRIKRAYNFTAGYNINTKNPLFKIVPSVMFRTDLADYRADITARFMFQKEKKNFYAGVGYAPMHSVSLFVGGLFYGIDIGYSYEANTRGLGLQAGNHELTLAYRFDLNFGKKGKNLHKTARWL